MCPGLFYVSPWDRDAALPRERSPGRGSAGDFTAQGRGYGSSRRGGVAEGGCGAVPVAERQGRQAEGILQTKREWWPKKLHRIWAQHPEAPREPAGRAWPPWLSRDRLQAPRERSLFCLSPISSPTPCAIIIKSVASVWRSRPFNCIKAKV